MEMESCVPPGFRFHPTEEELVEYYLKRKINSLKIDLDVIVDIDLYRIEPWDIQDRCRLGYEEQSEWYFFSHKDKKYPTGTRTNRATAAGFWKATGRDKEEGWVVCRAFKKPSPNHKQGFQAWNNAYYAMDNGNFNLPSCSDSVAPMQMVYTNQGIAFPQSPFGSEQDLISNHTHLENQLVELPQLDSPSLSESLATKGGSDQQNGIINKDCEDERSNQGCQYVDWKNLDNWLNHSNFPLVSQEYELNAHNHASHLFTCFPDL
ncbi:hypothetical protein TEA_000158 [Camellia sinensis var. sinensis]|uniref:NAC domain-containing protein n=1 Tax=Camellia sinensis var. sinensis TaxID=542762 RepID=A0A4S4ECD1_CAMSN|nr:hypothetical protein TEA_000158 [Camellia sinensis var. sinensis]